MNLNVNSLSLNCQKPLGRSTVLCTLYILHGTLQIRHSTLQHVLQHFYTMNILYALQMGDIFEMIEAIISGVEEKINDYKL